MALVPAPSRLVSERALVGIVGAVQFVNILDFMMVMPLGPDFALALDIPVSQLGLVGGSYTAAAAVSGLAGAFFLDRFDRRSALVLAMLGLVMGTLAGALAHDLTTLIAARVVAGAFGGPATSLAFSIISDVIPAERRGRAMGAVMGAFSAASVLGVPLGLELARVGGWRAPFIGVAGLGLVVTGASFWLLPSMHGHVAGSRAPSLSSWRALFTQRIVVFSYGALALGMLSGFLLIPNISPYLQQNLGYPRNELGILYLVGGSCSFVTMRLTGRLVDRFGSAAMNLAGVVVFTFVLVLWFVMATPPLPVVVLFAVFMVAQSTRNVALTTLVSKVPEPHERAGFMSVQSAVQHLAGAMGAMGSSQLLQDGPQATLVGMPALAGLAILVGMGTPPLVYVVEAMVRRRAARAAVRALV